MRRRIIKQGHNTLTVSLPRKWCSNHALKEGEEIEVGEKGNCLILSKETYKGTGNVSVDITGLDRSTIILLMQSLYIYGYDLMTITTKDTKAKYYMENKDINISAIINDAVGRLIGAEIISSSLSSYKIQVITDDSKEKFSVVLRRVFRLIIELFDLFIEGIRKKDKTMIEAIEFKHLSARKFANYALRLLNKFGHEEADKTTFYFAIITFLNKICEIIKNFAGHTIREGSLKLSKKCSDMIEEIRNAFNSYYESFYKYDTKQISELHKNRDLFKNRLYIEKYKTFSKDEIFILGAFTQIYDILLDLNELRMAVGY